jgi:cytosine/adenosine deaminase-related metal-dependent hydrolase
MQLLRSGWLLPITEPPIREGLVAVSGRWIVWLGRDGDPGQPDGPIHDLGDGILLPGLVNAHCHLELSHLAGRIAPSGEGFAPWVERVVATRGQHPQPEIAAAVDSAVAGLEASGTVALGEVSNTLAPLERLSRSSLDAVVFLELLSWDPAKAEATLAWGDEMLRRHASSLRPGLELRLAAHAPHSVSAELLRLVASRGGPASIHLAESPEEVEFLVDGSGRWPAFLASRGLAHVRHAPSGKSPVRYADGLGVLHERLVAAHGVQLDAADRALLAERGVHVVACPRSNARLGVGTADVPALLAAGVRLALGSDSLASASSLDVLDDAVLLHAQFPALPPAAILRMATLGGAEALGFPELGAIARGRRAALAYAPAPGVPKDPESFLLSGEARLERVGLAAADGAQAASIPAGVSRVANAASATGDA